MVMPTPTSTNSPLWDFVDEIKVASKEPRLFEFDDDPIAAACGSRNNWLRGGNRWMSLSDVRITEQDRQEANELRRYYIGRLTIQALRGRPMTEFRKKFFAILNDQYRLTENDIGMLMRLPYFYDEDRDLDEVVATTESVPNPRTPVVEQNLLLTPFKRILVGRRHGEVMQFWWKNDQNQGVCLGIRMADPLFSLIDSLANDPRVFKAKFMLTRHPWIGHEHNYYKMLQPRLV